MLCTFVASLGFALFDPGIPASLDDPLLQGIDFTLPVDKDPYADRRNMRQVIETFRAVREKNPVATLHLVLVTDKGAVGLANSIRRDHDAMKDLFVRGFSESQIRVRFHEFADGDLTPRNVIRTIATLELGATDTLIVYFAGHGDLVTTNEVVGEIPNVKGPRKIFRSHHVLKVGEDGLARANLRAAMERTGARLQVLLVDACRPLPANVQPNRAPRNPAFKPLKALDVARVNKETFFQLFALQSGKVDISTGEALADPERGGILTQCFVAACCYHLPTFTSQPRGKLPSAAEDTTFRIAPTRIDRDGDGFVNWRDFMSIWEHLIIEFTGGAQQAFLDIR